MTTPRWLNWTAAVGLACTLLAATASAQGGAAPPNTLTPAERKAGWRLLFDGATTSGWRGYDSPAVPAGWRVRDGALTLMAPGGDIVTSERFRNFELALEWQVSEGGNSGIFYRAADSAQAIYWSAPEMQVLDDARHPDGKSPLTSAGSVFGLYPVPRGVVKPAGEWNRVRLVLNGNHVEHWLNDVKVVEYELGSADWAERVTGSKFAKWPEFGKAAEGRIGLQDHGDRVAYRSVKIRVLP